MAEGEDEAPASKYISMVMKWRAANTDANRRCDAIMNAKDAAERAAERAAGIVDAIHNALPSGLRAMIFTHNNDAMRIAKNIAIQAESEWRTACGAIDNSLSAAIKADAAGGATLLTTDDASRAAIEHAVNTAWHAADTTTAAWHAVCNACSKSSLANEMHTIIADTLVGTADAYAAAGADYVAAERTAAYAAAASAKCTWRQMAHP